MVRTRTLELGHDKQQLYAVLLSCPFLFFWHNAHKTSAEIIQPYEIENLLKKAHQIHVLTAYLMREEFHKENKKCLNREISMPCIWRAHKTGNPSAYLVRDTLLTRTLTSEHTGTSGQWVFCEITKVKGEML